MTLKSKWRQFSAAGADTSFPTNFLKAGWDAAAAPGSQDITSAHTDCKNRGEHPNSCETHPNSNFPNLKPGNATFAATSSWPQVPVSATECEQRGSQKSLPVPPQTSVRGGNGEDAKLL